MTDRPPPTHTEHELPFERLSPRDFERLCLALVTEEGYASVRHPGASGADRGVDLAALWDNREIAFQCKRVRTFGPSEALAAVEKVLSLRGAELPDKLILLVTCDVSDEARKRASSRAGCMAVEVWGLTELDYRVRRHPRLVATFFGLAPAVLFPATSGAVTSPPKLPPHYQERTEYLARLERMLLNPARTRLAITGRGAVGIHGMGGIGKSVLAAAAAQKLAPEFPEGIFWISLGRGADRLTLLRELAATVGADDADLSSVSEARDRVREHLAGRRVLLILDDVWALEDAEALDVIDCEGRQILTTRNAHLLSRLGAQEICLDVLEPAEARELLAAWSGQEAAAFSDAAEVAKECGHLPLALAVAGALARRLGGWYDVLDRLRKADLDRLAAVLPSFNLLRALESSVEALDTASRERYQELAVFPDGAAIPEAAVATLWSSAGLGQERVRELIGELVEFSLARRPVAGYLALHDLQWDYLRGRAGNLLLLHRRIVDAYDDRCPAGFATGPDDGWFFQRLPWHLAEAGEKKTLRELLLSFAWLRAKLSAAGIHALERDYDLLPSDLAAVQIQTALRLSAHVVAADPDQLAGQLLGRLREADAPDLDRLLGEARAWRSTPWLQPMSQTLLVPGPLLRSLVTSKDLAALAALDERRLVAATEKRLELWDAQTGELLRTRLFPAASLTVLDSRTVAVRAKDGPVHRWNVEEDSWSLLPRPWTARIRSALAALSPDYVLKRWRRRFFRLRELSLPGAGSFDQPKPMSVLSGGRIAIVLADASLEIVDITSGRRLSGLPGALAPATSVSELDERHLVWARFPDTVEVWDLKTGKIVGSLGLKEYLYPDAPTITIPPGGGVVAVTTRLFEFFVWDWRNGGIPFKEPGFIEAMVWLDNRLLATLSSKGALQLWDTGSGETIASLPHAQTGAPAHLLRAGERLLISASREGRVRLWDLTQILERRPSLLAGERVVDIVFFDEQRAATSASDGTVRIWDVQGRAVLDTFTCKLEERAIPKLCVLGRDRLALLLGRTLQIRTPEGAQDYPLDLKSPADFLVVTTTGHIAVAALHSPLLILDPARILDPASGSPEYETVHSVADVKALRSRLIWTLYGRASLYHRDLEADSFEETPLGVSVCELAPLSDSEVAAVVRNDGCPDTLAIFDLRTGTVLGQWYSGADFIRQLVPAGPNRLASIATDSTVRVWDARAGKPLATFTLDIEPSALAVSPGGKTLLVGDNDGTIHFLDLVEPVS